MPLSTLTFPNKKGVLELNQEVQSTVKLSEQMLASAVANVALAKGEAKKEALVSQYKAEIALLHAKEEAGQEVKNIEWLIARDTFYISLLEGADSYIQKLLLKQMSKI
jgi:hypothetical protein